MSLARQVLQEFKKARGGFDPSNIEKILNELGIENYTIRPDFRVDVDGDVNIRNRNLETLPVRFGKIKGSFDCSNNNLKSLEGAPSQVGYSFSCSYNNLKSLEGAPSQVGDNFYCFNNNLTSLTGAPSEVGGQFNCQNNTKKFTEADVRAVSKVGRIITT